MYVKNTHSVTKTEISVFGRQALDAERRRSPSLADKVLSDNLLIANHILNLTSSLLICLLSSVRSLPDQNIVVSSAKRINFSKEDVLQMSLIYNINLKSEVELSLVVAHWNWQNAGQLLGTECLLSIERQPGFESPLLPF